LLIKRRGPRNDPGPRSPPSGGDSIAIKETPNSHKGMIAQFASKA